VAVAVALVAWLVSGDPTRFLAVLVVATPCPLLIAIPVTIIGAVSVAARHGIILRDPVVLERLPQCRTLIFDKTGTLTAGRPVVTEIVPIGPDPSPGGLERALSLVASAEQYSRHPLAEAIVEEAKKRGLALVAVDRVAERPGQGLVAEVEGTAVRVTGRAQLSSSADLPPAIAGLECVVLIEEHPALVIRFHDRPRPESRSFLRHLGPKHGIDRVLLVSGDREAEVRWFADTVGIQDVRAEQQPEDKVAIVREESARALVCMVGDGLNDAPALLAAHVGIALGSDHEVTSEAAGAIVLEPNLIKVDVLFHLARRQRRIALQSALGGMALSLAGMVLAAFGLLPPVTGALAQEGIDLLAVLNAVRTAIPVKDLSDVDLPSA
jgi:cation transport ATPase